MVKASAVEDEVVEIHGEPITAAAWEALKRATASEHVTGMPPTFPTVYRPSEFAWLSRLGVDLKNLLHAEQVYEYLAPLPLGAVPTVRTFVKSRKDRGNMSFYTLESQIRDGERLAVVATTMFVVRHEGGADK